MEYKRLLEKARKHYVLHLNKMQSIRDVGEMITYAHIHNIGMGLCWCLVFQFKYPFDDYKGGIFDEIGKFMEGRYYFEYPSDMNTIERVLEAISKRVELIDKVIG